MSDSAFWFVWNEHGRSPAYKHSSLAGAAGEAERLARLHPGDTFIVLQSVCARCVDGMQRVDLRPAEVDDIPF